MMRYLLIGLWLALVAVSCRSKLRSHIDDHISGSLFDEFGEPLAHTDVVLVNEGYNSGFFKGGRPCKDEFHTTTDGGGRFTIRFRDDCGAESESVITMTVFDDQDREIPYYFNHEPFRMPPKARSYAEFHGDLTPLKERYENRVPFYPVSAAHCKQNVRFSVKNLDDYTLEDTIFIVKPLSLADYTTGEYDDFFHRRNHRVQFLKHPFDIIEFVPARDGAEIQYSFFKSVRLIEGHINPLAPLYQDALYYTCDSRRAYVFENFNSYYITSDDDHVNRLTHLREKFSTVDYQAGWRVNAEYNVDIVLTDKCGRARIR